jgi:prepilin-type N-terminal cleavage/methylation domain-containing protein/prepilin-type processing-associated H-X9-DG protein
MDRKRSAFTLIEILVVVAIIALLIAILLPSLARAKEMARMVQCQSNMRQISMAFCSYVVENKGRLPGGYYDQYADWLGAANRPGYTGRQPDDGVIWKYMGRQRQAYLCPQDALENHDFSYSCNIILSGAKTEMLAGAHHPLSDFANRDHRASATRRMKAFEGVPMLIEEDALYWLDNGNHEGGWANNDRISERHLKAGFRGFGNIGFTDGHVGKVQLWPGKPGSTNDDYFCANDQCIHTMGRKWVSGYSWNDWENIGGIQVFLCVYGYMDHASPASKFGIAH